MPESFEPLIIECALNEQVTKAQNPHVPISVEELVVDPTGSFEGEATARKVRIAGRFDGKLTAEAELVVVAGGYIDGEVAYRGLQVEPGGIIRGKMDAIDEAGDA